MTLMRIRLELARSHEFPEGSTRHGYTFTLPLKKDGRFDRAAYDHNPEICTVHRFWDGTPDEHGSLIHRRNNSWAFSYEPGDDDDEPIFRFDKHVFVVGEYVTVTEHDGVARPFRVADVAPAIMRD